jgi:hypothetical protein
MGSLGLKDGQTNLARPRKERPQVVTVGLEHGGHRLICDVAVTPRSRVRDQLHSRSQEHQISPT